MFSSLLHMLCNLGRCRICPPALQTESAHVHVKSAFQWRILSSCMVLDKVFVTLPGRKGRRMTSYEGQMLELWGMAPLWLVRR